LLFLHPMGLNQLRFYSSMRLSNEHPLPAYVEELHRQASEQHDAWDWLPRIRLPTLILQGSEDPVSPAANATLLAERIPGSELHFLGRGRHMFFIEYRQQTNRYILDFLSRHPIAHDLP